MAEGFQLRIGLPKELAEDAGQPIDYAENARDEAGALERAFARKNDHNDESENPLQQRFVDLAGMPGHAVGSRENHRPRNVGRPAPKLRPNEIGDPPQEKPDGRRERAEIEYGQGRDVIAAGKQKGPDRRADQAAMKRHAPLPDLQYVERMACVVGGVVEEDIAEPSPDDDPKSAIDEQVVDTCRARAVAAIPIRVVRDDAADDEPAEDQTRDIGERVPADGQGPPLHQDGIDGRKRQDERRHTRAPDAPGSWRGQGRARRPQRTARLSGVFSTAGLEVTGLNRASDDGVGAAPCAVGDVFDADLLCFPANCLGCPTLGNTLGGGRHPSSWSRAFAEPRLLVRSERAAKKSDFPRLAFAALLGQGAGVNSRFLATDLCVA